MLSRLLQRPGGGSPGSTLAGTLFAVFLMTLGGVSLLALAHDALAARLQTRARHARGALHAPRPPAP